MIRSTHIAITALLLAAPAAAHADAFGQGEQLPVPHPRNVAVADVNEDGRPDLVAPSNTQAQVDVYLRTATGYGQPVVTTLPAAAANVAVADFDEDGHADLALGHGENVLLRFGKGDGTFRVPANPLVKLPAPQSAIAVGDLDADGHEDLVAATNDNVALKLQYVRGKGDGTFADAVGRPSPALAISVADLDASGSEDVVFGGADGAGVHRNDGGLGDPKDVALPGPATGPHALTTGDFDGDGRLDVAAAADGKGTVSVRLGSVDGIKGTGPDVPVGGAGHQLSAVAAADVDGDGDEDLVAADRTASRVHLLVNDGKAAFSPDAGTPVGTAPYDLAAADLDADGRTDVVAASDLVNELDVHYGAGPRPAGGNLLVNGGFEGPGAGGTGAQSPAVPGWSRTGGATFVRYGIPSHAYFPAVAASARLHGGVSLLWGGVSSASGGICEASQTVGVADRATAIDGGRATADLSARLGGARVFDDRMDAVAQFLGAGGGELGRITLTGPTAAQRHNLTTLLARNGSAAVPPGTRSIRVRLISTDVDKTISSATADDVRLAVRVRPAAGGAAGGPDGRPRPASASRFGARTRVRVKARRSQGRRVRVRIANANRFTVRARVRGRRITVRPHAKAVARLRLSRRRHRLTVVVRDPAGTRRRVSARIR